MPDEALPEKTVVRRLRAVIRAHPIICGTFAILILLGAVLGGCLLTEEWSLLRRVVGGAVAGASMGLLITAPRIIG
jgi:hypothetical protein